MNKRKSVFLVFLLWSAVAFALDPQTNEAKTAKLYQSFFEGEIAELAKLNLFLTQMPKGGDLHHHYSGSIYLETYLEWIEKKRWGIDVQTLKIIPKVIEQSTASVLTIPDLMKNGTLYRKLVTLWSNKDYSNHAHEQLPPDSNFFNTFGYFKEVSPLNHNLGLKILKERAVKENLSYIETMLSNVGVQSSDYFTDLEINTYVKALRKCDNQGQVNQILEDLESVLVAQKKFTQTIDDFNENIIKNHQGIDDAEFMMRYQTYAVRVLDPLQVFSGLLSAYLACGKNPYLVGVNIVAPENNYVALKDYTLHMRMYNYLKAKYPKVNRALHAGELTVGMVRPKNLQFHIKEALEIAGAQRIGHGVDIAYEYDSLVTLKKIKEQAVVEINLTSNEFILGVEGESHPYVLYESYGVPLVISTDDSGVSRNNLTNEYLLLASRYQPSYKKLKEYVFNSVKYSFLSDSDKQELADRVRVKFSHFEKEMAQFSRELN
ncbi:adenosine deaminase [Lentisphaera profundi]|uniref:adenosine deaminase n=1 Tax=Lentisphaera profundi TaxID=1658616 RepID=A0ABY7VRF3_9BACT|nr:adenosine deaminase [Lentisphaera profundi]WDE96780.1 adenosine deaminase [Lentisphaera profundi]